MITGDYDMLAGIAGNSVCSEDNGHLTVAWHKDKQCYYLKCGICGECKAVTKVMSLTEAFEAGEELPEPVASNVKKGIEKRAARLPQAPQAETFSGIPATDLGTGALVTRNQLQALVDYAHNYGLDPRRGHVCLMYSKPYITIDGYLYHARKENIAYDLSSVPLTQEERDRWQLEPGDHAWISRVRIIETGATFTGHGIVTKQEMTEPSKKHPDQLAAPVVAAKPWQMAQKRSEWQALRRAFPIGESPEEVDHGQG